jgi:hypothetical protein
MTTVVRPAVLDDVTWLLNEVEEFDRFAGFNKSLIPQDKSKFLYVLEGLILNHVFLVAEHESVPQGFIVGVLAPHHFNDEILVLTELLWWVRTDYRNTRAGAVLFEGFMDIGRREADWIVMTLEAKSPVKPETLSKRGFRLQETSYIHEVQH